METQSEQMQKYPKKIRRSPWPKINIGMWQMEIKPLEDQIRALKKQMRTSGHNITCVEDMQLKKLKKAATSLYMIRAASHGRLHLRSNAILAQKDEIGDQLKVFIQKAA
jgi:hypothetical protein